MSIIVFEEKLPNRIRDHVDAWVLEHLKDLEYLIDLFYHANWNEERMSLPDVSFMFDIDSLPRDGSLRNQEFLIELSSRDNPDEFLFCLNIFHQTVYKSIAHSNQKFDVWRKREK